MRHPLVSSVMYVNRQKGLATAHAGIALVVLVAAFYALVSIQVGIGRMRWDQVNLLAYLSVLAVGALLGLPEWSKLYARSTDPRFLRRFRYAWQQFLAVSFAVLGFFFLSNDQQISRFFLIQYLFTVGVILTALNFLLPVFLPRLLFTNESRQATIVVGSSETMRDLLTWVDDRAALGIDVVGAVLFEQPERPPRLPVPVLGTLEDLPRILSRNPPRALIVDETLQSRDWIQGILKLALRNGCRLMIREERSRQFGGWLQPHLDGSTVVYGLADEPLENPLNRFLKRALDLCLAVPICLLVLPPVCAVVALWQWRQSPGPLFFRQRRHGRDRRVFSILKFRSMHVDSSVAVERRQATRGDPRIFPFGAFLRRSSLDELPQFLNVLFGDMSVVGPRPHLVDHDHSFSLEIEAYWTRHFAKPGITGLAQVKGYRGEITNPALLRSRIENDIDYIRSWNIWRDLLIVAKTFLQVLLPPKSAY